MAALSEDHIEQSLIAQLKNQGYTHYYGPQIAPNSDNPQRENFASVILENQFKNALKKIKSPAAGVGTGRSLSKSYQSGYAGYYGE